MQGRTPSRTPAGQPAVLEPYTKVTGITTDAKGELIDYVVIRFTREDPVGGTLGEISPADL